MHRKFQESEEGLKDESLESKGIYLTHALWWNGIAQLIFTCLNSSIETLEEGLKYVPI